MVNNRSDDMDGPQLAGSCPAGTRSIDDRFRPVAASETSRQWRPLSVHEPPEPAARMWVTACRRESGRAM